ncbi:uncharacterized protein LOC118558308 isoform X2 [Fundulus heteroclitus]|uniref:uncharacterized protein LOC118558308 isoform X2 n=1 Tax=Fundulus heteroclitus TaxID=8078 RepID=UPI00165BA4A5|nr:uncharacterized protein LOC118558308 isoform X2 [Fundulus heteroclitus]
MEATSLQLFVLNQRTLTQWFNRRESTQEISILTQGLAAEDHIVVASSQLPPPREKLDEAPSPSGLQHEFALPPNRAAQLLLLNPGSTVMAAGHHRAAPPLAPYLTPATQAAPAPTAPASVSRFTERNRRRRAEEEATGSQKRKYVREVAFNKCSKCGQPKTKEFGHSNVS